MNNGRYSENLEIGKQWEAEVKCWLESKGYSVDVYTTRDEYGNEVCQVYTYLDGKDYPHPDFIVTKSRNKRYIEIKFYSRFYENRYGKVSTSLISPSERYLSIHKYQFESYVQLSRWKEIDAQIFFIVDDPEGAIWYFQDIEALNDSKIEVKGAYSPKEDGVYYFWNVTGLKKLGSKKKEVKCPREKYTLKYGRRFFQ